MEKGFPLRLFDAPPGRDDSAQIAAVSYAVQKHLGVVPRRVTVIPTLEDDVVAEVTLPTASVIFKSTPRGQEWATALEAWACRRLRRAGVPGPRVLGLDLSGHIFPGPFLLQEKVPGIPLSRVGRAQRRRWRSLRQAGKYLRTTHRIRLEGFGWLDGPRYLRNREIAGHYRRWSDSIVRALPDRLAYCLRDHLLDRKEIRRIRQAFEEHREAFRYHQKARLLHGDFGSSHIFVDPGSGKVTGIIDLADRKAGDPLWDIAWFTIWQDQDDFHDLIAGYGLTRAQVEASAVRFRLYVLLQAIGDIVWLHERKQATGAHVRAIRAVLTAFTDRRSRMR